MRSVFIATPAYSGSVVVEYVGALMANCVDLASKGVVTEFKIFQGNCYIALARNELVTEFLKSDATHLFFWDDDVGAPNDGISKLLSHDREVVAGIYPKKTEKVDYPVRLLAGAEREGDLIECEGLPTGFMLIRRDVIERMIEAYPERKFTDPLNGNVHHELFACENVSGTWWGEDYRFCQLARAIGVRVFADTSMDFRHVGRKVWRGRMEDDLWPSQNLSQI